MARLTDTLGVLVGHWRWVTAATVVGAAIAGAVSYAVLPAFYRSESTIVVVRQAPASPWALDWKRDSQQRMQSITRTILSDARLDPILKDFGLGTAPQVRRHISVVVAVDETDTADALGSFTVRFQSPDPRLSQKVTERLTSLFIVENFEDRARAGATARTMGDQFRVTKAPGLAADAVRPGMQKVTMSGAFAGLALAIVALAWRKD